jgi:hypothetical protein
MLLPDDEADAAIKDGWGVDAQSTYEYPSDFDVAKATKAAEDAAVKRAAAAEGPKPKRESKPAEVKEDAKEESEPVAKAADDNKAAYQTRVSKPKE